MQHLVGYEDVDQAQMEIPALQLVQLCLDGQGGLDVQVRCWY